MGFSDRTFPSSRTQAAPRSLYDLIADGCWHWVAHTDCFTSKNCNYETDEMVIIESTPPQQGSPGV